MAAKRARAADRGGQKRSQTAFRLREDVRPARYELLIEVDPQRSKSYRGRVRIELTLARAVSEIELHAVDLQLKGARVESDGRTLRAAVQLVPEHESAQITPSSPLPAGKAVLELSFRGKLRGDLRGLYFARSGKRRYAFTQLEAADARRFFPCFDEPSFKARFAIAVITDAKHARDLQRAGTSAALACRAARRTFASPIRPGSRRTWSRSASAICARAGRCTPARRRSASGTCPARKSSPASRSTPRASACSRLARYFGVPYPYEKLDLVAVPDFEHGRDGERRRGVLPRDAAPGRRAPGDAAGEEARARGDLPRARAHVVRQPRHHGVVGRPLAERGVRDLDGLRHRRRVAARAAHVERLRPLARLGVRPRRARAHASDLHEGAHAGRGDRELRPDHLRERRGGDPHARALPR